MFLLARARGNESEIKKKEEARDPLKLINFQTSLLLLCDLTWPVGPWANNVERNNRSDSKTTLVEAVPETDINILLKATTDRRHDDPETLGRSGPRLVLMLY
jgi:hypothetical protein